MDDGPGRGWQGYHGARGGQGPPGARFNGLGGMDPMGRMPMSNGSGHPGPMDGMPGAMGMGGTPYHSQMHGGGMQPQGGFGPPGLPGGLGFGFSDGGHRGPSAGGRGGSPNWHGDGGGSMGGQRRRQQSGGRGSGAELAVGPSRGDANDYCQHFVDTGRRPQNFLRDAHMTDKDRFSEYPKLRDLVRLKDDQVKHFATPPMFLKADLKKLPLSVETFGTKFDVILIDPPWEEYARRAPGSSDEISVWPWQDVQALDIGSIADTPAFVFLWCGSAEGLDAGRHCLRSWGFRRCEDICWIKTNKDPGRKYMLQQDPHNTLVHTKEHCLMGVRGNVRRNQDGHIIHANVDTDVIISDEPEYGSTTKPEEMYAVIEHFCLGQRRLELFGEDHNIRPGWVTVGRDLTSSNFDRQEYTGRFRLPNGMPFVASNGVKPPIGAPHLLPLNDVIEELRPRSPPASGNKR